MSKPEKVVGTAFGIFAMCLTAGVVLILGLALSVEYESNCTTNEASGKTSCSTKSAWRGWSGVPIQGFAGIAGTATTAYLTWRNARRPKSDEGEE